MVRRGRRHEPVPIPEVDSMISTLARRACAAALAALCTLAAHADVVPWSGIAAPEWTAMFVRTSGWTGADGVYSLSLDGDDSLAGATPATRTFFTFSDTFVGDVTATGKRVNTVMVNNTNAILTGNAPGDIAFGVRTGADGKPASMVVPPQPGLWIWPNDGLVQGGTVYLSGLRMKTGTGGAFNFAVDGMVWMTASASDPVPFGGAYTVADAPMLYAPATAAHGDATYGVAVMALTQAAHALHPDGFVYVYGVRNDDGDKKLLVARVKPAGLLTASAYRYWNGRTWVADITKAAPVADRMASEFSVTPLPDGRYLAVFQLDALSTTIAVRYGASPTGPWGAPIPVYACPDTAIGKSTYTYGAKAHPHLSAAGELLISYHVNTFSFAQDLKDADIYHPRFIRLPLN
jgi:hypothetical protein